MAQDEIRVPLLHPLEDGPPLIVPHRPRSPVPKQPAAGTPQYVGVSGAVFNLTKCIIGAGLLSMPEAFSLLGSVLGTLSLVIVALLTVFTVYYGILIPSVTPDACGTLRFGTYSTAVMHWCGPWGEKLVVFMLIIGLLGFQATYNDIILDVLLGSGPDLPGLLPPPSPSDPTPLHTLLTWLRDRRVLLGCVVLCVTLPLSLRRHMGSLNAVNAVGLISLMAFLVSLVWLAIAAIAQGRSHPLPLYPDYEELGDTTWQRVTGAFGVLSVLLTSHACHASMHPLMGIVRPFSRRNIGVIVSITIGVSASYYWLVMVCAYLVFGQAIQDDVLVNLSVPFMSTLVGASVAQVMALVLRWGYLVSVMGSAVLLMFPLRQAVADLILGPPPRPVSRVCTPRISQGGTHPPAPPLPTAPAAATVSIAQHTRTKPTHHTDPIETAVGNGVANGHHHTCDVNGLHESVTDMSDVPLKAALELYSRKRAALHTPVTLMIVALAYVLAIFVPSIWTLISYAGSTMGACCSFVIPAAMGLSALHSLRCQGVVSPMWVTVCLWGTGVLGVLMFVNVFIGHTA